MQILSRVMLPLLSLSPDTILNNPSLVLPWDKDNSSGSDQHNLFQFTVASVPTIFDHWSILVQINELVPDKG